jgi:uncharacterized protein
LLWAVPFAVPASAVSKPAVPDAGAGAKKLIYDEAGLLTPAEISELEALALKYGAERETDFIILTSNNPQNVDVMKMTQDFYDVQAPGYDKPHGNAAILTLDMKNREVYLAGFYKAEQYLDNERLDKIRNRITPHLTNGHYAQAFELYLKTAYDYMGYKPGVNPDHILFKTWFQLAASLLLAGGIVGAMAYNSGGRVTVHRRTYEDSNASRVIENRDRYIRTTVTKTKIPKNTGGGGGGGGGGRTGGGHSHSGSRGRF